MCNYVSLAPICLTWRNTNTVISPAPFSASNNSLDYLRSTLGRSYMCNAEQTLDVTSTFSLNTFRLQVQPFGITTNQFATGTAASFFFPQWLKKYADLKEQL